MWQGCAEAVYSEPAGPWQPFVVPCYAKHTDPDSLLQPGLEQGSLPDLPRVESDATGYPYTAVHGLSLMLKLQ